MGKWEDGFDYDYIDSFHALIKMKHEIANYFPRYSEAVFIAKEGIWIRYNGILHKMRSCGIQDEKLQRQMKDAIKQELGLSFFIRKKLRNIRRKFILHSSF